MVIWTIVVFVFGMLLEAGLATKGWGVGKVISNIRGGK